MQPPKTILCPTDFSEPSRRALKYAVSLGSRYQARLIVQHVQPPLQTAYYGYALAANVGQDYEENLRQQALTVMHELVEEVIGEKLPYQEILSIGSPTGQILACAEDENVDLIVMGTHGRSGLERFMLGSVTEKIIRKARCPVLAVREIAHRTDNESEPDVHYQTILVPVDLTDHSELTLHYAADLAAEFQSRLVVVYVLEPSRYPLIDPNYATLLADYVTEIQNEAKRMLQELVQSAIRQPIPVEPLLITGKIGLEILRLAKEQRADLIVMGARDSWMTHVTTIGTTAHRVLSHAECPVLILRGGK